MEPGRASSRASGRASPCAESRRMLTANCPNASGVERATKRDNGIDVSSSRSRSTRATSFGWPSSATIAANPYPSSSSGGAPASASCSKDRSHSTRRSPLSKCDSGNTTGCAQSSNRRTASVSCAECAASGTSSVSATAVVVRSCHSLAIVVRTCPSRLLSEGDGLDPMSVE